ncbi:8199_t:CDS:2 [Ambispora leptoticha]|uniref:8199_t:CDS:1 n=1 Tax=Ambispora leptoticha TaxID=144679 RepID=A0A9N8W5L9_9GLOM|nr:8199_t:CDS:2 [Ambispora leptoticha]
MSISSRKTNNKKSRNVVINNKSDNRKKSISDNDEEIKTRRTKKVLTRRKTRKTTPETQEKDDEDSLIYDYNFNKMEITAFASLNQRQHQHSNSRSDDKHQTELDALFEEVHHASKELSKSTIDHKLFSVITEDDEDDHDDIITILAGDDKNGNNIDNNGDNGRKRRALQDKTNWAQNKNHEGSSSKFSLAREKMKEKLKNNVDIESSSTVSKTDEKTNFDSPSYLDNDSNWHHDIKPMKTSTPIEGHDIPEELTLSDDFQIAKITANPKEYNFSDEDQDYFPKNKYNYDNNRNIGKNPITAENSININDTDSSDDPLTNFNEPPQAVRRAKIWMREEKVPLPVTISDDEFLF